MSPPEPLPADWAHIESMHSYGCFERWEGDDIVFGVGLNVWKTNKSLETAGVETNGRLFTAHVRGRLHFTTATPEHPAHLRVTHMEFRRPEAQKP